MHIRKDGGKSETEEVIFAAPGKTHKDYDTSPVPVANGYIIYTPKFKYLGSILLWDLNNCPDLENQVLQACKDLQTMMPRVF
eukprot:15334405-Ditylum_brightwellii.AAC.1